MKKPARTESVHANLMQRRDQAPAPTSGGISLERCAAPCGNAAWAVPRMLHLARCVHTCKPVLQYALGSKACNVQSAMCTTKLLRARKKQYSITGFGKLKIQTHTSAHFRLRLRPNAHSFQAHRCNSPPRPRNLRGRSPSMPTSCNAGTKLLPQRRRGISLERCAAPCGNAACAVPRRLHLALFFVQK